MAQKVVLIDDVDGSVADETVRLSVDGTDFEVDLSADNAAALRASLADWTSAARVVSRTRSAARAPRGTAPATASATKAPKAPTGRTSDASAIREWAVANGYDVAPRGRIASEIRDAYAAANA